MIKGRHWPKGELFTRVQEMTTGAYRQIPGFGDQDPQLGDFRFSDEQPHSKADDVPKWLIFRCVRGQGECRVPLAPYQGTKAAPGGWKWDGNREEPTLTPSINCLSETTNAAGETVPAGGCGWHGFIEKGVFREA